MANKLEHITLVKDDLHLGDRDERKDLVGNSTTTEKAINKIIDVLNADDSNDFISKKTVITLFTEIVNILQSYDMAISFDGIHIKDEGDEY